MEVKVTKYSQNDSGATITLASLRKAGFNLSSSSRGAQYTVVLTTSGRAWTFTGYINRENRTLYIRDWCNLNVHLQPHIASPVWVDVVGIRRLAQEVM